MIWFLVFVIGGIIGFGIGALMASGSYEAGYENGIRDQRYTQQLRDEGVI